MRSNSNHARSAAGAAISLAALLACSESTGPSAVSEQWTFNVSGTTLTGPYAPIISADLLSVSNTAATTQVVLSTETGRERFRITTAVGAAMYRAGTVLALASGIGTGAATSQVYDADNGRLLFALSDSGLPPQIVATVDELVLSVSRDTLLVASERATGREVWRRTIPGIVCTGTDCGQWSRIDTFGDVVTLYRLSLTSAVLLRVTSAGVITTAPLDRDAFRGSPSPTFATRTSASAPLVVATQRAATAFDPATGATEWRTSYASLTPAGFNSRASRLLFTGNGTWLTVQMIDSVGTAAFPARDLTLSTSDGALVRERTFTREDGLDLFSGPCGSSGSVRVLGDLRIEYTDIATGRVTTSEPVPSLAALRATPTVGGFVVGTATAIGERIVIFDPLTSRLFAVGCRV